MLRYDVMTIVSAVAALCILVVPSNAAMLRSTPQQGAEMVRSNNISKTSPVGPAKNSTGHSRLLPPGPNSTGPSVFFTSQPAPGQAPVTDAPQMFVAVLTTRATPIEKRMAIRGLWNEVDGGSGHICARFVVCQGADTHQVALQNEHAQFGDMLFLPCAEGYAQGLLTKKVIEALRAYRNAAGATGGDGQCLDRPLFMKMDDDTFVAGHRFRQGLSAAVGQYGTDFMYAGVDLPGQPPSRDVSSPWYEPVQTWPYPNYPPAMYGGPGYILGRALVHRMIDEGVADSHVLWNEDRAVGVWVHVLESKGAMVAWIRIPGTNGFYWDNPVKWGTWGMYPYTLHHHLSKACIYCLTLVDQTNDPNAVLDSCFAQEPLPGA